QVLDPATHAGRAPVVRGGDVFEAVEAIHQLFHVRRAELDVENRVEEVIGCDGAGAGLAGDVASDVRQKLHQSERVRAAARVRSEDRLLADQAGDQVRVEVVPLRFFLDVGPPLERVED